MTNDLLATKHLMNATKSLREVSQALRDSPAFLVAKRAGELEDAARELRFRALMFLPPLEVELEVE